MILVDTSVWVDYLRAGDNHLTTLLNSRQVMMHPFILGELACENLHNRKELLSLFSNLPQIITANDTEVLFFIEQHALMGRGIGYIDTHLLATVLLSDATKLWTRDKRLATVTEELGLDHKQA